jgi:glycosyltransferase involved in cell wall biosynthesis
MKIGFDATVLASGTRYTGAGEYTACLLRALASLRDGDEFVLYAPEDVSRPPDIPGVMDWRPLPRVPLGKLRALVTHTLLLPGVARRDGIDLFHVPTVHTRPSMPPVPGRLPCPLVVTVHDLIPVTFYEAQGEPLPYRMRQFYRWNLRRAFRAAHLLTVSDASKAEIVRYGRIPGDRVTVTYNGVKAPQPRPDDCQVLRRLGIEPPSLLYVGSWEPRKNLRRLLDGFDAAVANGLDADLVLVVERASGHAAAIRDYATRLDCFPRLRFLHSLAEGDLWSLYRNAAALAYPSLYEGFGLPPVQAMACGTPVVSSPGGALKEVLGDAVLYIDPLDTRSIADGLLQVMQDDGLRRRLMESGPVQAARYTWEDAAMRTSSVYHSLAGGLR